MRTRTADLRAAVVTLILISGVGLIALPANAADPSDQKAVPPEKSAKPMATKEPMAGEMKKDGMKKEDVSKAHAQWSRKMDEKMKQEKMK